VPKMAKVLLWMAAYTINSISLGTFWSIEMDDGVVILEEVDLVNSWEGLHAELFDDLFQLFIIIDLMFRFEYRTCVLDTFLCLRLAVFLLLRSLPIFSASFFLFSSISRRTVSNCC
jgi:hypothetical protein